nr:tetraspanin-33-like [Rhipicephalus microplus]
MAQTIDYLQTTLSCCGMTQAGYRDWQANVYFACNESNPSPERCSVPPSCCRHAPGQAVRRSAGNVLGGDAYPPIPSTLCGRGVLRMSDRDAWKVIHLGGCGDAIFQTLRAHNLELVLIMLVLVAYLLLLNSLASSVQSQIRSLKRIYDKYYETVYRGQQSMVHAYERCLRSYKARSTGALAANTPLSPAPWASAADGGMPNGDPS